MNIFLNKIIQHLTWDRHYKFFCVGDYTSRLCDTINSIGIITQFETEDEIPFIVCYCGQSEWIDFRKDMGILYDPLELWYSKCLYDSILFRNGCSYAIRARKFLDRSWTKGLIFVRFEKCHIGEMFSCGIFGEKKIDLQ